MHLLDEFRMHVEEDPEIDNAAFPEPAPSAVDGAEILQPE